MKIQLTRSGLHFVLDRTIERVKGNKRPKEESFFWIIAAGIAPLSIIAWVYYYTHGLTLAYNDARSHLNVSRRVFDSLQPGLAQIGSVWLPLQHILQLPTIMIEPLFRTGLSGSIVSMIAFIISGFFIWRIIRLYKLPRLAGLLAIAVFVLNPNMLFMQTTPMTEALMTAMLLGTTYYFLNYVYTSSHQEIIKSGAFAFFAVLTRYDGWFLFVWIALSVAIIALIRGGRNRAESHFILYATLGGFAIFLWLGWNTVIFGDPLFFATSQYSAKAQQDILLREGRLLTKGNVPFSLYTYALAVVANTGLVVTLLGAIGILYSLLKKQTMTARIGLTVLLSPFIFNTLSLYLGQSVIHLPQLPPYTYFNDRYGLMALPSLAIGTAFLAKKKIIVGLIAFIMLFQYGSMYVTKNIITINDAESGASGYFLDDIGRWLHQNAGDGRILVAASSHDALIFSSNLPLRQFVTEGAGIYWKRALKEPENSVQFVIMHDGDLVNRSVAKSPHFTKNFVLVYKGNFSNVYEKKHTNLL